MIRWGYVHKESQRMIRRCDSRDPFDLLMEIGAVTVFSDAYDLYGLKGYSVILNRSKYVVINKKLDDSEKVVVAGHEAAHLIIHRDIIINNPLSALKDFNIYDNTSEIEREANLFLADFLISDQLVLETIQEHDFFISASELAIPAPLLALKLQSMNERGFAVKPPIDADGMFLRACQRSQTVGGGI